MASALDTALTAIRAELRADRERNGLSFRRQAALLGIPFQTLHAFDRGIIGQNMRADLKAALARRFPQLKGHLAQLSLAWMDAPTPSDGKEAADVAGA